MSQDIKPGDVVKLRSNKPAMTVTAVEAEDLVWCQWFHGNELREGRFTVAALTHEGAAQAKPFVGIY